MQISHSNSHHFLVALSQWLFNKQSAFSCTFWQGHFGSLKYLPCLNLLSVQIKNKSVLTIKGENSMINILMKTFSSCLFLRPNSYKRPIVFWVTPSYLSHAKAAWQNILKWFISHSQNTQQISSSAEKAGHTWLWWRQAGRKPPKPTPGAPHTTKPCPSLVTANSGSTYRSFTDAQPFFQPPPQPHYSLWPNKCY